MGIYIDFLESSKGVTSNTLVGNASVRTGLKNGLRG